MTTPLVSILILTKNAGTDFSETLRNLYCARGIERAEVLVVDSGSEDRTLEIARSYPGVRIHQIEPDEFGHGKTRNLAASMATGEFLIFLVQDAVPLGDDCLEQLLEPFTDGRTAAVFGRQCPRETADPVEKLFVASVYGDEQVVKAAADSSAVKIGDVFFSNVFSAIRKSVWRDIPFDEALIMSEDQQWARDVIAAGYRIVYTPTACVVHSHQYSLRELFQRNFDSGYSLVGVIDDTKVDMLRREARFIGLGLSHLRAQKALRWSFRFVLFEAARVLGFALGQIGRALPMRLRRSLSMHKHYWS